jgi:murein L,D-transpeptidase YcbB/YkuD
VPETIKVEDIQPRLRQGGPGGGPELSVLRNNKLSVSYQGRAVDAATVDWARANIHSYTFTQPAGPGNVLGVLKFNFPNRHAIYMHDTLQPALFNQSVRTLSHGCIRVRQPARLAALLLAEDRGWPEQRVKELIAKGKNSAVSLSRPVPVHLTYFTVAFDGAGQMRTHADVYGIDKKMAAALFGKSELLSAEAPVVAKPKKRSAANVGVGRPNAIPGLFGN